eukprot:2928490-Amphidinium_carterae.1
MEVSRSLVSEYKCLWDKSTTGPACMVTCWLETSLEPCEVYHGWEDSAREVGPFQVCGSVWVFTFLR